MKKNFSFLTFLFLVSAANACEPLDIEKTKTLIQHKSYTDPKGQEWELVQTWTTADGTQHQIDWEQYNALLNKPDVIINLINTTLQIGEAGRYIPMPSSEPMENICYYQITKPGTPEDNFLDHDQLDFQIKLKQ